VQVRPRQGAAADATLTDVRTRLAALGPGFADLPVAAVDTIPVDLRHQSKIDRPALRTLREAVAMVRSS
jgi:hypothetical protein